MKILRIIKINFLALVAMPLLILATLVKLVSKAMEKAFIIIKVFASLCGLVLAFEIIKNPQKVFENAAGIFVFFVSLVFLWILTLISSVVMSIVIKFIGAMNAMYAFVYEWYASLYRVCYNDYCMLDMPPEAKGGICLIYTLLWILNRIIIFFATHALKIMIVCNIGVVCWYAVYTIRRIYDEFGMNLFEYLKLYGSFYVIEEFILELAVLIGISIALIVLGIELGEWGRELRLSASDYEAYAENIRECNAAMGQSGMPKYGGVGTNCADDNNHYLDILAEHIRTFDSFMQEVRPAVEQGGNDVLKADYAQYVADVNNLVQLVTSYGGQMPAEFFEKMIPAIKRLDAAKKRIEQQAEQIIKAAQKQESSFFKGCDTKEKLEKRYKALCKIYHPDTGSGDEDTFKRMNGEYETRKKNFA